MIDPLYRCTAVLLYSSTSHSFVSFLADCAFVHTVSKEICISEPAHSFAFAASDFQGGFSPRTRAAIAIRSGVGLGEGIIAVGRTTACSWRVM